MVRLHILSGSKAGTQLVARHFPVRVGRAANCDLCLEENGVWEQHAQLSVDPVEGFVLQAQPDSIVTVNKQPVQSVRLHNGDSITLGSAQIQFWLGEVQQRGVRLREWLVWATVSAVTIAEIAIIYQLSK